jgi:molecular chaperone DnaK (HSP70)
VKAGQRESWGAWPGAGAVRLTHPGDNACCHGQEATAWEPTVGGASFDAILARLLTQRYTAQQQQQQQIPAEAVLLEEALKEPPARALLLAEARRVKETLSASTMAYVTLDGLPTVTMAAVVGEGGPAPAAGGTRRVHMDGALHTNISREEFERLAAPLLSAAVTPAL